MQTIDGPQPEMTEAPAPVKKPRKPRAKKPPKVKPVDKPINLVEDHPALQSEPDPRIDAEAAAAALAKEQAEMDHSRKDVTNPESGDREATTVQVRKPGTWGEIEEQIVAARKAAQEAQKPHFTPPPTARQQEKINAEIEAGRKRNAYFAEQERLRQQIPPQPGDAPPPTPVFRPKDFVPKVNSKDPAISSQNIK